MLESYLSRRRCGEKVSISECVRAHPEYADEIEDLLPKVYEEEVQKPYPGRSIDENLIFDSSTFDLLKKVCDGDQLLYESTRNLLNVERKYRLKGARHGLFEKVESTIRKGFYADEEDALQWKKSRKQEDDSGMPSHGNDSDNIELLPTTQPREAV